MPLFIYGLEVHRRACRNFKCGRAVLINWSFSKNDFYVPCSQVADRGRTVLPTDIGGHEIQRDDPDFFHCARSDTFQSQPVINVLNSKSAGLAAPVRGIGRLRGDLAGGQGNRLIAGNSRVRCQKHALALFVHEINPKLLLSLGPKCHQIVFLIQRIRILPLVSSLPVPVDFYDALKFLNRCDKSHAARFLPSHRRVDDGQLPALVGMVPGKDGQNFPGARNATGMENCRGKVGVVSVILGLLRTVRVHPEQRLGINLAAIVVFPACIRYQPGLRVNLGIIAVHLVESNPAHVLPVFVHQVHIAHAHVPAVHVLNAPRGTAHDVAIRQVDSLIIGEAQAGSELAYFPRLNIHFIQMIVIAAGRLFSGEENALAVIRHVRVP